MPVLKSSRAGGGSESQFILIMSPARASMGRTWPHALATISAAFLFLSGCTAKLAPDYDQALADGLSSTNKDMHVLFADIGSRVDKSTYPSRDSKYNNIIGSLNALAIQADMRPPGTITLTDINDRLSKFGIPALQNDKGISNIPSARSIKDAADTIIHMRDADKADGLHGNELKAFENQADTFVSQAIAYEAFLKR